MILGALVVDLAYALALVLVGPFFWLNRRVRRKPLAPFRARWSGAPQAIPDRPVVWVHGVSVGEIRAARRLVEELSQAWPEREIVLSTTTVAGFEVAQREYPGRRVFYAPFDFSWCVFQTLSRLRPTLIVLMELEIWPNLLGLARRNSVPVVLVNGKLSLRSAAGYRKLLHVLPRIFDGVRLFCMQNEVYTDRLKELGIGSDRISVTGSVKADNLSSTPSQEAAQKMRQELLLAPGSLVFLAGSTHPGEEEAVLDAYERARAAGIPVSCVLAPRHLGRLSDIETLIRKRGFMSRRKSTSRSGVSGDCVVLVDTMGELDQLFAVADLVFLGGSLARVGGHNILEPAACGKPVVVGPHTWTVRSLMDDLLAANAVLEVRDSSALAATVVDLLRDEQRRHAVGMSARRLVDRHRGATRRTADLIVERVRTNFASGGSHGQPGVAAFRSES